MTMSIPPPNAPFYGPFLNACDSFPVPDFLDESMRIERAFNDLCAGVPLAQLERTTIIAAQPAPFPMLAIQQATNTAVILHAIGTFFPPLGYRDDTHIAAGTTIAFIGEAMRQGTLPPLVTVPAAAFADARRWPTASDDAITTTPSNANTMLPPNDHHHVHMSQLIPISPYLVRFFVTRAHILLPQLCKQFIQAFLAADPLFRPMLALTAEFLHAAATAAEDGSNPEESQLAIAIDPLLEEARLTCWGISHYTIYSMLAPLAPVQNIGGTVGGPSQLPPTPQQPPVQPAPQQPPAWPAPQQPPAG